MIRPLALADVFERCRGLGFGKGQGAELQPSYWSDVSPLSLEDDIAFFAHSRGMSFHYPKRGFLRQCAVPCLAFVDLKTHAAGYVMKKWRVFDLLAEALQDEEQHPWRSVYENSKHLPLSFYVNVCDPNTFSFEEASGRLCLADWYVDVVKVVVADVVLLTSEEQAVRNDLLAKGLLQREQMLTLGNPNADFQGRPAGVRTLVQEFAPELVDEDDLQRAVLQGFMDNAQARKALVLGHNVLADCTAGRGVFEPERLERLLEKAFEA